MNNTQYRQMVDHVVENVPGAWNGRVKQLPLANNNPFNFVLQFPAGDSRQGMQLIYRTRDLYILGYIDTSGTSYVTFDQINAVPGAINLGYDGDYASLGWNRQGYPVNGGGPIVSVAELEVALYTAATGRVPKDQLCVIAVALAEGVRFKSVEKAVRHVAPISTQMVDWQQQIADGDALLLPG